MPIINVPVGGVARSIHVQQILNWLRGNPSYSEPVTFTGINSSSYALTVLNLHTDGKGFLVKNSAGTKEMLAVRNSGITMKPSSAGDVLTVRNLADDADLFKIHSVDGVTVGGIAAVTLTGTQTLTNKTLTSPTIASPIMSDYSEYVQIATPTAPAAGSTRLYSKTGTNLIHYRTNTSGEKALVDTDTAQTLTNKIINQPVIGGQLISDYVDHVVLGDNPSAPGATYLRLYPVGTEFRFRESGGAVHALATQGDTQTLTSKTLTAPHVSALDLTSFMDLAHIAAPGAPAASYVRLYAPSDNLLHYKQTDTTDRTLVTTDNTQTLTNKILNSPSISGLALSDYIEATQVATPTAPAAGKARIYSKTGTEFIHFRTNTSGEKIVVDTDSAQTLITKTLNSPIISAAAISDYNEYTQVATPTAPAAGKARLYSKTGTDLMHFRTNTSGEKILVDTDTAQTLTNKTLTSPIINSLSLAGAIVSNYIDYTEIVTNPGAAAGKIRMWAKDDNNLYITLPNGTPYVVYTSGNTPATGTSLARAISLGGL